MRVLEYYLSLISYFCSYIHYYAQLAELLQALKMIILKLAPLLGQQQRVYTLKTKLLSSFSAKLAAFHSLQGVLAKPTTFIHYKSDKILQINLDTSKKFGFGVVKFYTSPNKELPERKWLSRSLVQPILFLSYLFTLAKKNYQPIELEIMSFI